MSTSPRNQSDLQFGAQPRAARQPTAGEPMWTIRKVNGTVLACELRDQGAIGAEVHVLRDGVLLYSQRFPTRAIAWLDAETVKAEHLANGGTLVD